MARMPSGTVTFLFTDIEGSTRMWEVVPDVMAGALARHDALLRSCVDRHDGCVFKTVGDAFCAAFHTAPAALAAACDAQRTVAAEPWPAAATIRVRMALHTGSAEARDDDYFGQPLNRVARLLSSGHGGQILLSLATQELVRDSLPDGVALRDMGSRRLKDLIRPERVYQVLAAGLPADFPPLKTLDARANNLPVQATSFVGREREIVEVKALLQRARLVTLTGAGGAGKTRLSLQVAADLIDDHTHGAWFAELASLRDPALVPQTVAAALGVAEVPGVPVLDTLVDVCREKDLLLVLDNCEHLIGAAASLCQALLSGCRGVAILASTREALRVPGEVAFRVPSLPAPARDARMPIPSLTQYAAVQLFVDRAQAANPDFRVTPANAPSVASICHHLDGIPLAIELAAARLRSMTAEEVDRGLDRRFQLLTGGARTALPRQQTLRSLVDWSHGLLDPGERALFARLSVFAGGWTLDAAEGVCAGDGIDEERVLDLLAALVDKSLVLADEHDGATRYRMLETLRQYAQDRLRASHDEARGRDRHLAHFLRVAEAAEPHLSDPDQRTWFDRLEVDHDNLRAALAWATDEGSAAASNDGEDRGLRLAGALFRYWIVRRYPREGSGWLSSLLAVAPERQSAAARAKAQNAAGALAWQQGDYAAARGWYEGNLATRRASGDRRGVAVALGNLTSLAHEQGDLAAARAMGEQSLAAFHELGERRGVASLLNTLGNVARDAGDLEDSQARHAESLAMFRDLGDSRSVAIALDNLGLTRFRQGDHAASRALHDESLAVFRSLGDRPCIAMALNHLAILTELEGDHPAARNLHQQGLAIQRDLGDRRGVVESLEGLAAVACGESAHAFAAALWGAAAQLREEIGAPHTIETAQDQERRVGTARDALGTEAFGRAWQAGAAMTLEQAVRHALGEAES